MLIEEDKIKNEIDYSEEKIAQISEEELKKYVKDKVRKYACKELKKIQSEHEKVKDKKVDSLKEPHN